MGDTLLTLRLRSTCSDCDSPNADNLCCRCEMEHEAADEIERLREHVSKRSDVIAKLTDDVTRIAKERDEARARIAELEAACLASYRAWVHPNGSSQFVKDRASQLLTEISCKNNGYIQ